MLAKLFNIQPLAARWARSILKATGSCTIVWEQTAYSCDWLEKLLMEGKR